MPKPELDARQLLTVCCGYYGRLLIQTIAVFSILLPWLWFDGHPSASTGADILAYIIAGESSEKFDMMKHNFMGAFALLVIPMFVIGLHFISAVRIYQNRVEVPIHISVIVLVAILLLAVPSVTSNDRFTIGPMLVPGIGLILMILANAAIIATIIPDRRSQAAAQRRQHAEQYDWDPTV